MAKQDNKDQDRNKQNKDQGGDKSQHQSDKGGSEREQSQNMDFGGSDEQI